MAAHHYRDLVEPYPGEVLRDSLTYTPIRLLLPQLVCVCFRID